MKRYILLLLMLFLVGCGRNPEKTVSDNHSDSTAVITPVILSEDEVRQMFLDYAQPDWIMIDCIPVTDSDYGIAGVVQYTTDSYRGCRFDFLTMNGSKVMGVGAAPAGEDRLVYLGGDSVSCELVSDTGEYYTCTITYYETDTEIGFEIS